jgi:hypothetical protein
VMNMSRRLLPSSAFYTPAAESTAGPLDSTHSTAGARIGSRLGPPPRAGPPVRRIDACMHPWGARSSENVTSAAYGRLLYLVMAGPMALSPTHTPVYPPRVGQEVRWQGLCAHGGRRGSVHPARVAPHAAAVAAISMERSVGHVVEGLRLLPDPHDTDGACL